MVLVTEKETVIGTPCTTTWSPLTHGAVTLLNPVLAPVMPGTGRLGHGAGVVQHVPDVSVVVHWVARALLRHHVAEVGAVLHRATASRVDQARLG